MMESTNQKKAVKLNALPTNSEQRLLLNEEAAFDVTDLNLFYDKAQALKNISMVIPKNRVTAFIGPSGCGKSTYVVLTV